MAHARRGAHGCERRALRCAPRLRRLYRRAARDSTPPRVARRHLVPGSDGGALAGTARGDRPRASRTPRAHRRRVRRGAPRRLAPLSSVPLGEQLLDALEPLHRILAPELIARRVLEHEGELATHLEPSALDLVDAVDSLAPGGGEELRLRDE